MLELKALLLTQGMHGMVSQVEGLAKALKLRHKHHPFLGKNSGEPSLLPKSWTLPTTFLREVDFALIPRFL